MIIHAASDGFFGRDRSMPLWSLEIVRNHRRGIEPLDVRGGKPFSSEGKKGIYKSGVMKLTRHKTKGVYR